MLNSLRHFSYLLTALALCLGLQAREAHAQTERVLPVILAGQKTNMWCWATGFNMAAGFKGTVVAQCDQANHRFGRNDCCNNPTPVACVQGGWPEHNWANFNVVETPWGVALTFDQLKQEIIAERPVTFAWGWTGGGGHIMVARGYRSDATGNWVYINDPWPVNAGESRWITYADFVSVANDHTTQIDYSGLANRVVGKEVTLTNKKSGLVLSIANGSTAEGAQFVQSAKAGVPGQTWKIYALGDNHISLAMGTQLNVFAGVQGNTNASGAKIVQSSPIDNHYRWKLEFQGDGSYVLRNQVSGLVMGVEGGSTAANANIIQTSAAVGDSEKWKIE